MADHIAERMPDEIRKEVAKNPSGDMSASIESVFLRVSSFSTLHFISID